VWEVLLPIPEAQEGCFVVTMVRKFSPQVNPDFFFFFLTAKAIAFAYSL